MFVEEKDISAALKKSVGRRETCETTTDDDNLGHNEKGAEGEEEECGRWFPPFLCTSKERARKKDIKEKGQILYFLDDHCTTVTCYGYSHTTRTQTRENGKCTTRQKKRQRKNAKIKYQDELLEIHRK